MKIIAVVNSAVTQWMLIDEDRIVQQVTTEGINPNFQSRRDISHLIRLSLPDTFFRRRWERIYFYGAGCRDKKMKKRVADSLVAQFRTPVVVESNLLGVARSLFGNEKGIACILGVVSNSGVYDGSQITEQVRPLGYLLGDEGSGAYFGKTFLSDYLKGIAPKSVRDAFEAEYEETVDEIINEVYLTPSPEKVLVRYSQFLHNHVNNDYVYHLLYTGFMKFFTRNVSAYDYNAYPISFVGDTAKRYEEILRRVASDFGTAVSDVRLSAMEGLFEYHMGTSIKSSD